MDKPENAPESCPGTQSDTAGKGSACAGCPNQSLCASGVSASFTADLEKVKQRMASVRYKIAVLSGKGGVGKSTFTSLLARYLASLDSEKNVGVVDIDICGPSIPRLMGVLHEDVHMSGSGWCPVYADENLAVMSVGFLLKDSKDAVIWRGNRKTSMLGQLLSEVDWGSLEYLIIDAPPGTSDEHISASAYLRNQLVAVVVTTPQQVSLLDVRKEIDFCRKVGIRLIGVVENMASFTCPKCKVCSSVFPTDSGGVQEMCKELSVPFLGSLPLDPQLTRACDEGRDPFSDLPDSDSIKLFPAIAEKILESVSSFENE